MSAEPIQSGLSCSFSPDRVTMLRICGMPGFQRLAGSSMKPCGRSSSSALASSLAAMTLPAISMASSLPEDWRSALMNARETSMPSCSACSRRPARTGWSAAGSPFAKTVMSSFQQLEMFSAATASWVTASWTATPTQVHSCND